LAILLIVGLPFTVSVKIVFVVRPLPFFTMSVILLIPLYTATGVKMTEQMPDTSGPVRTIASACTNAVLLDAPVTINEAGGVTASLTVKANAGVDVPMLICWLTIRLMAGEEPEAWAGAIQQIAKRSVRSKTDIRRMHGAANNKVLEKRCKTSTSRSTLP